MFFNKWTNKQTVVHPYNGMLFSDKKKNAIKSKKTRRNLKCILVSERRASRKATYCMIPTIWYSRKGKTVETGEQSAKGSGQRRRQINSWSTVDI